MEHVIIRGGTVVDGTGKPGYCADVEIRGGTITAVGDLSGQSADQVLDAGGLTVAPGFIDAHAHSDTAFLLDDSGASKLYQGVTTEVTGNCGSSPFPALSGRLRSEDGVSYVSVTARERETMEQSMASLNLLVLMLIVCSGILAFITLYDLTNINIMERTREIATVKVLGFLPGETAAYILRENMLLSFLGGAVGLGMGKVLHRFVMELVDVENMTVEVRILPMSYVWSFLITLVFAALTNAFMRLKLEKVDMAESLKSVE